jgi:hypothetical protein
MTYFFNVLVFAIMMIAALITGVTSIALMSAIVLMGCIVGLAREVGKPLPLTLVVVLTALTGCGDPTVVEGPTYWGIGPINLTPSKEQHLLAAQGDRVTVWVTTTHILNESTLLDVCTKEVYTLDGGWVPATFAPSAVYGDGWDQVMAQHGSMVELCED